MKLVGVMVLFVLAINIYLALEQLQLANSAMISLDFCPGDPSVLMRLAATFDAANPSHLLGESAHACAVATLPRLTPARNAGRAASWTEVTKTALVSALPIIASIWSMLASLRSPVDLTRLFQSRDRLDHGHQHVRFALDFHALDTYAKRYRPHRQGSCRDRCTLDCLLRSSPGLRLGTRAWAHSEEAFVQALTTLQRAGVVKLLPQTAPQG